MTPPRPPPRPRPPPPLAPKHPPRTSPSPSRCLPKRNGAAEAARSRAAKRHRSNGRARAHLIRSVLQMSRL
eukprot:1983250-Pleurochrysis_carterae.AAC.2